MRTQAPFAQSVLQHWVLSVQALPCPRQQAPCAQPPPDGHTFPQPPQLFGSVMGSTQRHGLMLHSVLGQSVEGAAQVQLPPAQVSVCEHTAPHAPQLLGSVARSKHSGIPPQVV